MELTNIREIFRNKDKFADKEVTIGGWVRSNRNSKNFGFIVVNDGTFFEPIQVVYGNGLDNYDEVGKINVGAAIIVRGTLVLTPDAKQPFEIQAGEWFDDRFHEGDSSEGHQALCHFAEYADVHQEEVVFETAE